MIEPPLSWETLTHPRAHSHAEALSSDPNMPAPLQVYMDLCHYLLCVHQGCT